MSGIKEERELSVYHVLVGVDEPVKTLMPPVSCSEGVYDFGTREITVDRLEGERVDVKFLVYLC